VATVSYQKLPIAPELLDRNFIANSANQKWAGAITYVYTSEGWFYVAVIIDLHSRGGYWLINRRAYASQFGL
jgi:putative transposase